VDETQVADSDVPEDTAVLSPDGVIKGLNFSAETGMLWPVTGETLISFSPDHAIYHKTLDSYRTSNYVYLGSEQGTHVAAAADGVVTSVKEDVKTGTTVTMRVSENHEIIYGLLSDVTVKEGDYVDAGTVFATVAEPTRYYLEEGSGVYIQVLDQGEAINPMLYLQ
jgi:septal ring factor EnvC (AmiA/AmiB activator)